MSNVWLLTKVLIKNNVLALSGKASKKSKSSKGSLVAFITLMGICTLMVAVPMAFSIAALLKVYDLSELFISIIIPIGGITSIIFGIFSIINIFYFSKDNEQLLPLPIKSSQLLMAKFFAGLLSEYFILLMFIFPLIFGIGVGIGASFVYYLYTVIICVLMPVIPSVIVSLILMLANKVFNFGKRKDLFMYLMTGVILLFSFAYTYGLSSILDLENPNSILLSSNSSNFIETTKWFFIPFNSARYSLVHYSEFIGLAGIISFVGINILSLIVLYFLGDKLYIKGITRNGGTKRETKKIKESYKVDNSSIFMQLVKKEWRIVKRTPIFMLNVVVSNLIFPIIFIISFLISISSEMNPQALLAYIDIENPGVWLIFMGIIFLMSSMASGASSAISREGSSAWMMKTIPVSLKKQIDAKVFFSFIIDFIILLSLQVPLFIIFKLPIQKFLLINVPLVVVLLISNYISILVDLAKPRLDWKDETEAVKQNFNVFIGMMISMFISIIFAALGALLLKSTLNIYLIFVILSVVLLVIYVAINALVKKREIKLFNKVG